MNVKLQKWQTPDSYMGPDYFDYYVFLGRNRDSDLVSISNFEVSLKWLGGESETVRVIRDRHWACGWIEYIIIHERDHEAIDKANGMLKEIEAYPALDDQDYSEREWEAAMTYWESLSFEEKKELCVKHDCELDEVNPDCFPANDTGSLFEALTIN